MNQSLFYTRAKTERLAGYLYLAILLLLTLAPAWAQSYASKLPDMDSDRQRIQLASLVIDGKTFMTKEGLTIRMIGVDAPTLEEPDSIERLALERDLPAAEVERYAREAKSFLQYLIEGRSVFLELDPLFQKQGHQDAKGRLLAYVWFTPPVFKDNKKPYWVIENPKPEDKRYNTFANAAMIVTGHAFSDQGKQAYLFKEEFRKLEFGARSAGRGVWQAPGGEDLLPGVKRRNKKS